MMREKTPSPNAQSCSQCPLFPVQMNNLGEPVSEAAVHGR